MLFDWREECARILRSDVMDNRQDVFAQRGGRVSQHRLPSSGDRHARASVDKGGGDGKSQSGSAAGDQCDLSLERKSVQHESPASSTGVSGASELIYITILGDNPPHGTNQ